MSIKEYKIGDCYTVDSSTYGPYQSVCIGFIDLATVKFSQFNPDEDCVSTFGRGGRSHNKETNILYYFLPLESYNNNHKFPSGCDYLKNGGTYKGLPIAISDKDYLKWLGPMKSVLSEYLEIK